MKKIGHCKQCLRNVPHILHFRWPVLRLLNRWPEFAASLPRASWYCCACEKNTFKLQRPLDDVLLDSTSTDMDDIVPWRDRSDPAERGGFFFRRKPKQSTTETVVDEADEAAEFEKVGNFLRSDESLLVQQARVGRYTKKFREGVVDRILSGGSTITQVRKELGLSERDILNWINDRVLQKDARIAKLTEVVDAVRNITADADSVSSSDDNQKLNEARQAQFRIYGDVSEAASSGDSTAADDIPKTAPIIEGRVKSR
jgi:transposase-like protein